MKILKHKTPYTTLIRFETLAGFNPLRQRVSNILSYLILFSLLMSCNLNKETISIMTYNVRYGLADDGENSWQYRKEKLVDLINSKKPDFLGTQEGLPFQVSYIKEAMPNYTFIGKDRDNNGKGENTAIYYNKTKYSALENETFWLATDQTKPTKDWDAAYPRIYTYGLFQHIASKKMFWVVNTHFDHIGKTARINSAKIIIAKIKEINKVNQFPVIFMGDLNAVPTSKPIEILKSEFKDTTDNIKSNWTFNGFVFDNPIKKRIDYIFISKNKNIKINTYEILTNATDSKYPSDHFPVYVELTF